MEHLERHGFLRRGIARHARLSLQLRNQSARTLAQAPSWRRHSSPPLPPGVGSRLEAPGCTTYVRYVSSAPPRPPGPGFTGSGLLAVPRTPDEPLGHGCPVGGCGAALWAADNVADFVAFHLQVLGFVYNSTLSLRLRRKRNTSILVTVR